MKEAIFAFLIALAIGAVINGFSGGALTPPPGEIGQRSNEPASEVAANPATPETSDANFENDVLNATGPVVVDFYANNCPPCMKMAPIFSQLASDNTDKARFFRLDAEQNSSVTARFNINTFPTFVIFKGGQRIESFTGVVPKDILAMAVKKAL